MPMERVCGTMYINKCINYINVYEYIDKHICEKYRLM